MVVGLHAGWIGSHDVILIISWEALLVPDAGRSTIPVGTREESTVPFLKTVDRLIVVPCGPFGQYGGGRKGLCQYPSVLVGHDRCSIRLVRIDESVPSPAVVDSRFE